MTRKTYITIGASTLGVVTTYVIINRIRKRSMLNKLDKILKEGAGATGTGQDLEGSTAFNPNYWKQYSSNLLPAAEVDRLAKQIYNANKSWYEDDDEQAVHSAFDQMGSWVHVSQVADRFNRFYKWRLYEFLEDFLSPSRITKIKGQIDRMKRK